MDFHDAIKDYIPKDRAENAEREIMLEWISKYGKNILTRENKVAHFTVSGLIFNEKRNMVLMVHHNIYNTWSWTGGHADGQGDFLVVAIKECLEETGLSIVRPISEEFLSLNILTVQAHEKRGQYINAHLHFNISYALEAEETLDIHCKEDENSDVKWVPISQIEAYSQETQIIPIYKKIIKRVV